MYFSKLKQSFYAESMLSDYEAAGALPADLVEIPDADHHALLLAQGAGKIIDWSGAVPVAVLPPPLTLEEVRAAKLAQIRAESQAVAAQMTAGYPEFEIQTWPDQQRDVLAWQADSTAATPSIDQLAAFRGIPRELYLEKTLAKVTAFRAAGLYLAGTRQRYEDQIKAATTVAALDAITFTFSLG